MAYDRFLSGTSKSEFWRDAEEIAGLASSLKSSSTGTQRVYSIEVPSGAKLKFENKYVIAVTESPHRFDAEIEIIGPTLGSGEYNLKIVRTEKGVEISG